MSLGCSWCNKFPPVHIELTSIYFVYGKVAMIYVDFTSVFWIVSVCVPKLDHICVF